MKYIKYKIERIHIHKLKHIYAKFNLHWYIKRLFVFALMTKVIKVTVT